MPATNPELSGARSSPPSRKRTLSTKAATNGDPNAERKRQKLEAAQKKGMKTTTLTKKKPTTTASKKTPSARKAAKTAPHSSVDIDPTSDDDSDMHVDAAAAAPDSDIIDVDDVDEDSVEVLEAPEESAEAQMRTYQSFFLAELIMILNK
jgi:hypothetical protein